MARIRLPKIMMAEPLVLAPGVGTTCISTLRLPTFAATAFQIVNALDSGA